MKLPDKTTDLTHDTHEGTFEEDLEHSTTAEEVVRWEPPVDPPTLSVVPRYICGACYCKPCQCSQVIL